MTNLTAAYDGMPVWLDGRGAAGVVRIDFSKASDTVSRHMLVDKFRGCGLGEWTVRWTEIWLNKRGQRVVIRGTESR